MDPMDFTMDDGQGHQHHNSAGSQYHCQGSLPYSYHPNGNSSIRGLPMRGEGQPYDPVHDNSGPSWYHNGVNMPNSSQAHASYQHSAYPHTENTSGGNYHNIYPPAHDHSRMQALSYQQYMGGRDGSSSSAGWTDRSSQQNRFSQTYSHYPSSMMNSNLDPNGQNVPVSQGPPALPNPNPHSTAQRQEYQAARVDQENIRNRVNAQYSAPTAVPQEPRLQQQPRLRTMPHVNYHAGPSSRPMYSPDRPDTTTLRNERNLAAQHRATLAAATAATIRSRALRTPAAYSDDDDEDDGDVSPRTSPGERYRHADHYLFASEQPDERMMAAVRGAMSQALSAERERKKVPSKEALASLIKITVEEVEAEGKEIHCIICYNNYGEANPEKITEDPLKLPKCGHIFGNICIKQWFESHDTCPYCRDQLPSETSHRRSLAVEQYRMLQERMMPNANGNDNGRAALARARSTLAYRSSAVDGAANYAARLANDPGQRPVDSVYASPNRPSTNDSSDRRRSNRGRLLSGRPSQPVFTRTTPSARVVSQRAMLGPGSPGTGSHPLFTGSPYRGMPAVPSDTSSSVPGNRISTAIGSGVGLEEEASPAVADGSFISIGDRMPEPAVYTGNFAFPGLFPSQFNQPQTSLSNTQTFSSTADLLLSPGAMEEQYLIASHRDNASRSTQGPNVTNMPLAENSGNAPTTPQAERQQPSGNPASLPPNFRPRWTR